MLKRIQYLARLKEYSMRIQRHQRVSHKALNLIRTPSKPQWKELFNYKSNRPSQLEYSSTDSRARCTSAAWKTAGPRPSCKPGWRRRRRRRPATPPPLLSPTADLHHQDPSSPLPVALSNPPSLPSPLLPLLLPRNCITQALPARYQSLPPTLFVRSFVLF